MPDTVDRLRHPLQGTINIVRFNAPTYALAAAVVFVGVVVAIVAADHTVAFFAAAAAGAAFVLSAGSLVGSYLTYDRADLYSWASLDVDLRDVTAIAHVHTGLDESTDVLRRRHPHATVQVFDASDAHAQTEPSIARARHLIPLHTDTVVVGLGPLPVAPRSLQRIVLPMAAHEVRDHEVRARWLARFANLLTADGRVIVVEHLRDVANALAFHVGVLHFFSRATWLRTFDTAGFDVVDERGVTPFLRVFVLAPRTTSTASLGAG